MKKCGPAQFFMCWNLTALHHVMSQEKGRRDRGCDPAVQDDKKQDKAGINWGALYAIIFVQLPPCVIITSTLGPQLVARPEGSGLIVFGAWIRYC